MPVVKGRKTDKEKFAGAEATYTIECHDARPQGPAVRHQPLLRRQASPGPSTSPSPAGTTSSSTPHQTSWGVYHPHSSAAVIMTHGDNNGLVLPPAIAPIQVVVVPIAQHKPGVLDKAAEAFCDRLKAAGLRVKMDDTDQLPRLEVRRVRDEGRARPSGARPPGHGEGPVRAWCAGTPARRSSSLWTAWRPPSIQQLLEDVHDRACYAKAKENLEHTHLGPARPWRRSRTFMEKEGGFARTKWCGDLACELAMKEQGGRLLPLYASEAVRHHGQVPCAAARSAPPISYWALVICLLCVIPRERSDRGNPSFSARATDCHTSGPHRFAMTLCFGIS